MKATTTFSSPLLTTKMFKKAVTSFTFAALVGVFCGFAFIKIAVQANNRMLTCQSDASKLAFTNLLFGTVLYCKTK